MFDNAKGYAIYYTCISKNDMYTIHEYRIEKFALCFHSV